MKAARDRSPKAGPASAGPSSLAQAAAVALLLAATVIMYLAFSSSVRGLTSLHEVKRLLTQQGDLHLCEVDLEKCRAEGGSLQRCEDNLKSAQANLKTSLARVSLPRADEAQCPKCPTCAKARACPKCPLRAACPACADCPAPEAPPDCPKPEPPPACPKPEAPLCPPCAARGLGGADVDIDSLAGRSTKSMDVEALRAEIADLRDMAKRLIQEKIRLEGQLKGSASWGEKAVSLEAISSAKRLLEDCGNQVAPASSGGASNLTSWKGYQCKATDAELQRFLNYKPRGLCPQDWYFTQKLMYAKDCFALPRRRCLSITPPEPEEPMSFPASLFDQGSLKDASVRWDLHQCKSFECLNTRKIGDCRNCFNLALEKRRWKGQYRGSIKMEDVIKLKNGTLRLGLDAGGGTGSFAAHMALYNVTVMTTAFNVETVPGRRAGLPYMETIALRGLIPLHVPHKSRLPLYDGTLDIVHSVNSIKYLPPLEFEELLYEWDRVLRAGGVLWFEMFYAPVSEMPVYVQLIEMLGYKKLYWNYTPKPDAGEREGEHVYLNCVIEKPARPGTEVLDGPPLVDTQDMI